MRLEISTAARTDLLAITKYSAELWGKNRAKVYLTDIRDRMRSLAKGELSGNRASEVAPGLRRRIAGSHFIWYRISGDVLFVIRVLHQSRDAARWLE